MHTKNKLAAALREAGLEEMATKAEAGYFHDYLSPLDLPEIQLDVELHRALAAATASADQVAMIRSLIERHHGGDFDASIEESDDWAKSPEGQRAFESLLPPKVR